MSQSNYSPLCTLFTCLFTPCFPVNTPSHSWHSYLSPSWIILKWWSKRLLLFNFCWQMLQSNVTPSWLTITWLINFHLFPVLYSHFSQLKRIPLCLMSTCRFSCPLLLNTCLHNSQVYVTPKWAFSMCLLRLLYSPFL